MFEPMVSYQNINDSSARPTRFLQFKKDELPEWAAEVRDEPDYEDDDIIGRVLAILNKPGERIFHYEREDVADIIAALSEDRRNERLLLYGATEWRTIVSVRHATDTGN